LAVSEYSLPIREDFKEKRERVNKGSNSKIYKGVSRGEIKASPDAWH